MAPSSLRPISSTIGASSPSASEWDADPGYYALRMTPGIHHDQRLCMAVAWCAYYNLGIAADASTRQGAAFWNYLEESTRPPSVRPSAGTSAGKPVWKL